MLESLLRLIGAKKKKLPLEDLSKFRSMFSKLRTPDARNALLECEALVQQYEKKYNVSKFKEEAQFYRGLLYK